MRMDFNYFPNENTWREKKGHCKKSAQCNVGIDKLRLVSSCCNGQVRSPAFLGRPHAVKKDPQSPLQVPCFFPGQHCHNTFYRFTPLHILTFSLLIHCCNQPAGGQPTKHKHSLEIQLKLTKGYQSSHKRQVYKKTPFTN